MGLLDDLAGVWGKDRWDDLTTFKKGLAIFILFDLTVITGVVTYFVIVGIIQGTVIDVRINKGNAAQSFMFKIQGWRSMGGIMENTSFWLLVAIMQPLLYFISLEYFGQIVAIAIPWSILILFLIWMWASGKNPFASDEEE